MKDKARRILIVILSGIAFACAGYLIWYYGTSRQEEVIPPEVIVEEDIVPEVEEVVIEEKEPVVIPIDFASLEAVNSDVYAWIRIPDTVIDYPVVQCITSDNRYLNYSWDNKYSSAGAIFSQAYNSQDFTDFNTVIYGHQMGAGVETMFHQLTNYLNAEFMDSHREIIIYTPEEILTYRVFAAVIYDDRHLMQSYNYSTDADRQAFIDSIWNSRDMRSQFRDDVDVTIDDHVLSLSTCITGENNHRLLIEAVLIDE